MLEKVLCAPVLDDGEERMMDRRSLIKSLAALTALPAGAGVLIALRGALGVVDG